MGIDGKLPKWTTKRTLELEDAQRKDEFESRKEKNEGVNEKDGRRRRSKSKRLRRIYRDRSRPASAFGLAPDNDKLGCG